MKVIILGKGDMLTNLIRGCLISGAEIVGVFRYENLFLNKFQLFLHDFFKPSPELTLIKKHKLNDIKLKSANSNAFKDIILKTNADIMIVGTWAEKINADVFNMPKIASINVHPSLLPKYRGSNPYLQTIWNGETYSGITFHIMTDKLDAGPILIQQKIEIFDGDTGKELRNRTVFNARLMCAEIIERFENGYTETTEQLESHATYYKDVKPEDMTLNFEKETSTEITRHIRAFHPFRPTYIQDGTIFWITNPYKIAITDQIGTPGKILNRTKDSLTIACKDNKAVELSDLKKYNKFFK